MKHHRFSGRGHMRCAAALASLIILFSSFPLPQPAYASGAASAAVQKQKDKLSSLEKQRKELADKIASLDKESGATLENKRYLDSLITATEEKIHAAEELISELDSQIALTEASVAESEENIEKGRERIREQMRQSHEGGKTQWLEVLTGAEGIGDLLSRAERINSVLEYDKNTVEEYKKKKAELTELRESLSESKELQSALLEELKADKAESERLAREAADYFKKLENDKKAAEDEYSKAKAAEEELNKEIERLLEEAERQRQAQAAAAKKNSAANGTTAPQTPAAAPDGNFMWPLPTGKGYISCYYGDLDPKGRVHYATDIAIGAGTPIYASNSGTVIRAAEHYSYGNYVLIDHGGSYSTLYAHCSSLAVVGGQQVEKGQVIGYVGTTGFSEGNHLHFEFRVGGKKVNALNYVPKGC